MKRFSFFLPLAVALVASLYSLSSCQKDNVLPTSEPIKMEVGAGERSPTGIIYGVTLYDGVNPCRIIGMDQNTGAIVSQVTATYFDGVNNIPLDNLKGICLTDLGSGPLMVKAHFLTTGNLANPNLPATSIYNDALFKVDPTTGQCSFASTSTVGTVSDVEYDPNAGVFHGLRANTNGLVTIVDNANNFGTYSVAPINGIAAGYTLKGLSLVRDANGIYLVGCATSPNFGDPAKLYRIPVAGALVAGFLADLNPVFDFTTGHCAIGYDRNINRMLVNRSGVLGGFGLSSFPWTNPLPTPVLTGPWGANGVNFEDLSSSIY